MVCAVVVSTPVTVCVTCTCTSRGTVGKVVGAPAAAVGTAVGANDGIFVMIDGARVGKADGAGVVGAAVVVGALVLVGLAVLVGAGVFVGAAVEGVAVDGAPVGTSVCPTKVGATLDGVGAAVGMPESSALPGTPAMLDGVLSVLERSAPTPAAKSRRPPTSDTIVSEADSDAVTLNTTRTDVLGWAAPDDTPPEAWGGRVWCG